MTRPGVGAPANDAPGRRPRCAVVRVWSLLRNEMLKAGNGKLALIGILVSCLIALILAATIRPREVGAINGWVFIQMVMLSVFTGLGMIFVVLFSAQLFAEETGTGTIRLGLCAPVRRREFFAAKVLVGHFYMIAITLVVLALAVTIGGMKYSLGSVSDTFGVIYSTGHAVRCLGLTVLLSWVPLSATVMVGILVSTWATRAGVAMGIALGLVILLETLKHFVGLGPWLFTNHLSYPWVVFHEMAQGVAYRWGAELWRFLSVCGATWLLASALALFRFCRRDLNV